MDSSLLAASGGLDSAAYQHRYLLAALVGLVALVTVVYALSRTGRIPATEKYTDQLGGLLADLADRPQTATDGSRAGGIDFDPNWRRLFTMAIAASVIVLPLTILAAIGAWPFGPWTGYVIFGMPAYWFAFFVSLTVSTLFIPFYVYFISGIAGGGTIARLLWIIAAMASGGTLFDRGRDGRYHARPLRKGENDTAEYYVDGEWKEVPGNIEYVDRLGWRPVAFCWEKTDETVKDIKATDLGEHPVDYLTERGIMERDVAMNYQPSANGASEGTPIARADGSGKSYQQYLAPDDNPEPKSAPYNILDYEGHVYHAFNPFPDGGSDDELVIDTRKLLWKLTGSGQTNLIERAKDVALTDTAKSTRLNQAVGYLLIFLALFGGAGIAWLTV